MTAKDRAAEALRIIQQTANAQGNVTMLRLAEQIANDAALVRLAQAEGWDEAIAEAEACGLLHEPFAEELRGRNPYRDSNEGGVIEVGAWVEFGDDGQPLPDPQIAEFQHNALEMAQKADAAERRAEEAEYHVEQLRDALDSAERIGERAAELATERDAALARIARAERLIDSWERDAPDHSNPVFIGRLRECLRRDPAPVRLRSDCDHDWLDRPESDTRECLICGTEVAG